MSKDAQALKLKLMRSIDTVISSIDTIKNQASKMDDGVFDLGDVHRDFNHPLMNEKCLLQGRIASLHDDLISMYGFTVAREGAKV